MRIKYDPAADAVYVYLVESEGSTVGKTIVNEQGVIIDTDPTGVPRGFEFLSVRINGLPLNGLPDDARRAIKEFVDSGALSSDHAIDQEYK